MQNAEMQFIYERKPLKGKRPQFTMTIKAVVGRIPHLSNTNWFCHFARNQFLTYRKFYFYRLQVFNLSYKGFFLNF